MKKMIFLTMFFLAFGILRANPDYALNIWMQNKEKGGSEYFIEGQKASPEQVSAAVKKIIKIDKSLGVHIIVNKNCNLLELYRLSEIIKSAGAKSIVASVFIAVRSNKKRYQSLELNKIKFTTWNPFDTSPPSPPDKADLHQ